MNEPCNFRVGQRVVCIDSLPAWLSGLSEGAVYTVSAVLERYGQIGLQLKEVASPFGWAAFRAGRFRPAVEPKTDISIFHQILDDVNKRANIEAPQLPCDVS